MKLLIATRSPHKFAEIGEILSGIEDLELVSLDDVGLEPTPAEDDLEPYDTFEQNALSKARWYREKTGLPTVSDDSGLSVDALGGAPGVRSKRWSGSEAEGGELDQANNRKLLRELIEVPLQDRTARYVCAVAFVDGEGEERTFRGEVHGRIEHGPQGTEGFGYDPLFLVPALGATFGLVPPPAKHAHSHRGRAFRSFRDWLLSR